MLSKCSCNPVGRVHFPARSGPFSAVVGCGASSCARSPHRHPNRWLLCLFRLHWQQRRTIFGEHLWSQQFAVEDAMFSTDSALLDWRQLGSVAQATQLLVGTIQLLDGGQPGHHLLLPLLRVHTQLVAPAPGGQVHSRVLCVHLVHLRRHLSGE